ncbi:pyridoxamine 5'-phosphate oxidase [Zunongwangia profunda]|jgi:pyridoxamine 5'-phosphate oxidase|uniref:pyridoxamine 5'-phosphate oxidase n=1 Tax=Zunongwangia profunda TaxID=398743 RepID=UPI001D19549D|nr:pyridoxamine 5'-phosphate oxidase [Zunongwangia profunda]MCC4229220.1 pyridoxamine 5'-phosphate oxidase [Zunongwangia profunda]|tara:strand:+ start:5242 stop:5886 length:645 start_codon:yes stop_codon:yes gene_type:complete
MSRNLQDYRQSYEKSELLESNISDNPFELFERWFNETEVEGGAGEVNAMTIATIGLNGFPKSRVVLLKSYDSEGFIFYTNFNSEKGKAIAINPNVCLSFFWPSTERQVIIQGVVEKVDDETATEYYHSRPRGSQLGAWASPQSSEIASREVLENNLAQVELKYKDHEVPKPENWGGYIVKPVNIEFWQGRQNRLHDRIIFNKEEAQWNSKRLAP